VEKHNTHKRRTRQISKPV